MKIGIRLHDLAKDTPENAFKKAKETGFDYIQLVFKKSLKDENGNFLVFNEENAKKENGEEYDEYVVNNAKLAQMHANHSLGELIEVKSCITEDLSPVDKFCKMQYESEMNQAIEALVNKTKLDDIFKED